ncbi:minor capsid protein [Tepidimicrobium xylanilyticum]
MILLDVRQLLINYGIEEEIFIGILPASPDNVVSFFISGGYTPTIKEIQEPTFQVRVRHADYLQGYKLIEKIKNVLINTHNYATEEVVFHDFFQIGDIAEIGKDENGRTGFTINFRAYVTKNKEGIPSIPPGGDCEEKIRELLFRIEALETEKMQLEEQITQKQEVIDTLITEKEQLEQEINSLISQIVALENEVQEKSDIIIALEGDINNKQQLINQLEAEITEKEDVINQKQTQIDVLEVEKSQLQQKINSLTVQNSNLLNQISVKDTEIDNLNNIIQNLEQRIEELEQGQGSGNSNRRRILIDLGSPDYATDAPGWNNLTDCIEGKIESLIDENGEGTGIGIEVYNSFDSVFINSYTEDFGDYYYHTVSKDGFFTSDLASLLITGLNPDKYYRITIFASSDTIENKVNPIIYQTDEQFNERHWTRVSVDPLNNPGTTSSRTLQPSENGEIYITFQYYGNKYQREDQIINSIEIEEMNSFVY